MEFLDDPERLALVAQAQMQYVMLANPFNQGDDEVEDTEPERNETPRL